jgi:hypothetical protein
MTQSAYVAIIGEIEIIFSAGDVRFWHFATAQDCFRAGGLAIALAIFT